jgi:flagellar biosynthesis component FlhA
MAGKIDRRGKRMKEKIKEIILAVLTVAFIFGILVLPLPFYILYGDTIWVKFLSLCCYIIFVIVIIDSMRF